MKRKNEIESSTGQQQQQQQQKQKQYENDKLTNNLPISTDGKSLLALPKAWFVLVAIRFGLNLFGQRGYLHPDEFFQSIEPLVGDLFNCSDKVLRTWEFNFESAGDQHQQQQPIRNMLIPYTFYGVPLLILKWLSGIFSTADYFQLGQEEQASETAKMSLISVQSNTLIYFPRMFMTFASLLVDIAVLKVSEMCELDASSVLLALASSYISMIYMTRTMSNSIETILFALLLYLVVKSIKAQRILNEKFLVAMSNKSSPGDHVTLVQTSTKMGGLVDDRSRQRTDKKVSTKSHHDNEDKEDKRDSSALKRLRLFDIYKFDSLGPAIGLVVCIGVFNRPTFILFALAPVFYWLLYGLDSCNSKRQAVAFAARRSLSLCVYAMPCAFLLALFDTAYFNRTKTIADLLDLVSRRKLIITPYNFFIYNTNKSNLAEHGEHAFYQHALVNCFLLFGLNYLLLVVISVHFFSQSTLFFFSTASSAAADSHSQANSTLARSKQGLLKLARRLFENAFEIYSRIINNTFCFFVIAFSTPLLLFTLVPHQEPRFLLPLLIPVCFLTGHCVFGVRSYMPIRCAWIVFNFVSAILYGYMHQGGLVASLHHAQKIAVHTANLNVDQHFIFYHTYMPPRSLLVAPFAVNIVNNKRYLIERKQIQHELEYDDDENSMSSNKKNANAWLLEPPPHRQIYDLMSSSTIGELEALIENIKKNYTDNKSKVNKDYAIFLITPSPHNVQLELASLKRKLLKKHSINYQLQTRFKFHIGFEDLKEHIDCIKCTFRLNEEESKIEAKMKENLILNLEKCKKTATLSRIFNCFSLNFYQVLF
jgi:GPI mannosyltransferase 4